MQHDVVQIHNPKIEDLFDIRELEKTLDKVKGSLFFKKGAGFLGRILGQVEFKWSLDLPTAAISVDTLYWNPQFFDKLDKETRITVLAHELWHNALLHTTRLGNRCPDIWNVAADHVINLLLEDHGYYMGGFPYIMDQKYAGWSTEEVYDDLISSGMKPLPNPSTYMIFSNSSDDPCDNPGDGNSNKPDQGFQSSPDSNFNSSGTIGPDIVAADPGEEYKALSKVISAVTTARMIGEPGSVPGEITQIIDEFLNPKLPWETILYNFFNALTCTEYSYARPNRRYDDPILPGRTSRNGLEHILYFVDISGSITDEEILRCNSEVKFIQEDLNPERLSLITFDTKIRNVFEYERDDPFDKLEIIGRGGTDLKEVFQHIIDTVPTAVVIFSDLCVDIPENPGFPIIWVCTNNPNVEAPPFGKLIHMKE